MAYGNLQNTVCCARPKGPNGTVYALPMHPGALAPQKDPALFTILIGWQKAHNADQQ